MSKQGAIAVVLMASLIGQPAAAQGDGQLVLEPKSCQRSRMMNKLKQQPNQGRRSHFSSFEPLLSPAVAICAGILG